MATCQLGRKFELAASEISIVNGKKNGGFKTINLTGGCRNRAGDTTAGCQN